MPLELGKSLDRSFNLRIPFLNGFYKIGIFFHKNSNFLLFRADPDFPNSSVERHGLKINMFKNLETSKFCESCLQLHNYRGENLDISNQFDRIKDDYHNEVIFIFNEAITLSKYKVENKEYFSQVMFYGLTISGYESEFIFIIAERQHIMSKLKRKVVRTTAIQLATTNSLNVIKDYYDDYKLTLNRPRPKQPILDHDKIIKLEDTEDGR